MKKLFALLFTLCSITTFAQFGNFKAVRLVNGDSVSAGPMNGTIYYDPVLNIFRFYENGSWKLLGSGSTNALTQGSNTLTEDLDFSGTHSVCIGCITSVTQFDASTSDSGTNSGTLHSGPDGFSATQTTNAGTFQINVSEDQAQITTSGPIILESSDLSATVLQGTGTRVVLANNLGYISSTTLKTVNGNSLIGSGDVAVGDVTGSGTANQISLWSGSKTQVGSTNLTYDATNNNFSAASNVTSVGSGTRQNNFYAGIDHTDSTGTGNTTKWNTLFGEDHTINNNGSSGSQVHNSFMAYGYRNQIRTKTGSISTIYNSGIIGGQDNYFSVSNGLLGSSGIFAGTNNRINVASKTIKGVAIIGGEGNVVTANHSVVIGGFKQNLTDTSTVQVPLLKLGYVPPNIDTTLHLLGRDPSGHVVTVKSSSISGGGITALTGDVTASGSGSVAATIKSNVALSGSPTTTTQSSGDNSTKISTTAYADASSAAAASSKWASSGSTTVATPTIIGTPTFRSQITMDSATAVNRFRFKTKQSYGDYWMTLTDHNFHTGPKHDEVFNIGYNTNGSGGRAVTTDGAAWFSFESDFNGISNHDFEIHLEVQDTTGTKNKRIWSYNVAKGLQNGTGFSTINSFEWRRLSDDVPYAQITDGNLTLSRISTGQATFSMVGGGGHVNINTTNDGVTFDNQSPTKSNIKFNNSDNGTNNALVTSANVNASPGATGYAISVTTDNNSLWYYSPSTHATTLKNNDSGNLILTSNSGTVQVTSKLVSTGLSPGYTAITGTYTVTATDYFINCTANSFTVTLPTAVGIAGTQYIIKNSGSATVITMATTSSQTIDGSAPGTITTVVPLRVMSNGANWITF